MDFGTSELALVFSGIVCIVGVANFRATHKERELARIEAEHQRELETREWRTETRATLGSMTGDIKTVKSEQRELRSEVQANAEHIHELSARHDADVARLSGRIEAVDGRVGDLRGVMQGDAELDLEMEDDRKERK